MNLFKLGYIFNKCQLRCNKHYLGGLKNKNKYYTKKTLLIYFSIGKNQVETTQKSTLGYSDRCFIGLVQQQVC